MLSQSYYEAIIQLRPADKEIIDFIVKQTNERKGVFISKIEELKTGIDLYISSQRFARALGKKLKKRFRNGELVTSRKLFTVNRETGKKVYRVTVLFRLKEKVL